jgi:hypothetical protein
MSHITRAQHTPSAVATVQVSHALSAVRFSCLLRGRGASFKDGVAAGEGFLCATPGLGWVWLPCGCVSCDPECTHWTIVITNWEIWTVAAADGVCCAHVRWEINFLFTFETAPFFCVCPVLLEKKNSRQLYWRVHYCKSQHQKMVTVEYTNGIHGTTSRWCEVRYCKI